MINNRLFKKINSVFWAVLTWLPIVLFILASAFRDFNYQFDNQGQNFWVYFSDFFGGAAEVLSNSADLWYNPLSPIFSEIFNGILDTVGSGTFYSCLNDLVAWACWVQVMRLFAYVFMWFIDLLTSLFDYLSFNKRGDN